VIDGREHPRHHGAVFDSVNHFVLGVMDGLLGWLLALPRDLAIVLVAVLTVSLFAIIRKFATNQDLLRRCAADKKRLRARLRDARKSKDKEALVRLRGVKGLVLAKAVTQEWKPLLAALPPIALLGIWCWQRLEFLPPPSHRPVAFTATFPLSAAGQLAHLAPEPAFQVAPGWVQAITVVTNRGVPIAAASWSLEGPRGRYTLALRHAGRTYEHPLLLGERKYEVQALAHDVHVLGTSVELKAARLLGCVPGVPALGLAPWLAAYLVLALLLLAPARRLLRVA
jgi:uncharacterized membrane protein (DUF106 family)